MADYNRVLGHGLGFVGQLVQGRVQEGFDSLSPSASGGVVEATLGTTEVAVPHRLGKLITGWTVIDIDADATVYRTGVLDDKFIGLTATAACNVKLMVF